MQGRIAGFLMTIFMALPLAAIPLMSIFGIPRFDSFASTMEETGFLSEDPLAESSAPGWDDSEAPVFGEEQESKQSQQDSSSPDSVAVSFADEATSDSAPRASSPETSHQTSPTRQANNSANQSPDQTDSETADSGNSLTWNQAIQRLAECGITEYRIKPGLHPGSTHFACFAKSSRRSTIIRFEAEAADPLTAVKETLRQVEPWHHSGSGSNHSVTQ